MKVLIVSYNNCANFGDRIGLDLVQRLLPPETEVFLSPLPPFWVEPHNDFDLVIVGTGHSIFHKSLEDKFLDFLEKQNCVIGIFGLQYHNLLLNLSLAPLKRLFSILKCWFSRSKEDILFLDSNKALPKKYAHLGDWLINSFPLVNWSDTRDLIIPAQFIEWEQDIQRTIQKIQSHKRVSSARLHPILCALTSAEEVKYEEQLWQGREYPSGKYRSMFLDIFNKCPSPGEWFKVDRDLVISYKKNVYINTEYMRKCVWEYFSLSQFQLYEGSEDFFNFNDS